MMLEEQLHQNNQDKVLANFSNVNRKKDGQMECSILL
jgi:hypothetical protein